MASTLPQILAPGIPVILAPMSGVTDMPFRKQARRFGATLTVTEMVASDRLAAGEDDARERLTPDAEGATYAVQLAGRDPRWMAEAARIAEDRGAHLIDINMGCPAKRVVGGYAGSALMRELDTAVSLIETTVAAVRLPVSVKMRLGWDDRSLNAPQLARRAADAGVALVSVHGRTRCQFYDGAADWRAIGPVKAAVGIPVFANGDIGSITEARDALAASGADGVLIGRACVGRPWLLGEIAAALNGASYAAPRADERLDAALSQLADSLTIYGPRKGLLVFRKHLSAYLEHHGVERGIISALCRINDADELRRAMATAWSMAANAAQAA